MQRIAQKGGLISIGYWKGAVCNITREGIIKSLSYAIDLVGEDQVALVSDLDGSTTTALDPSKLSILIQTMVDHGFSDSEIKKVMGGATPLGFWVPICPKDNLTFLPFSLLEEICRRRELNSTTIKHSKEPSAGYPKKNRKP